MTDHKHLLEAPKNDNKDYIYLCKDCVEHNLICAFAMFNREQIKDCPNKKKYYTKTIIINGIPIEVSFKT